MQQSSKCRAMAAFCAVKCVNVPEVIPESERPKTAQRRGRWKKKKKCCLRILATEWFMISYYILDSCSNIKHSLAEQD